MRIEFNMIVTFPNGHKDYSDYGSRKYAEEAFNKYKDFYKSKGCTVRLYKTYWIGGSLHHSELLGE